MSLPRVPIVLGLASVLAAASIASAQSMYIQHPQIIAATGDPVPGLTMGELFGGSGTFSTGVMDDSGKILFRGRIQGGTATLANDRALFYGSSRNDLQIVIRSGDPEPSGTVPGAVLTTSFGTTGVGGETRISANGTMMFGATMFGGGVTTANDTAFYVGTPGSFQMLVREGDPAVGTAGATYSSTFSTVGQQLTALNAAGDACFQSNLAGGDVSGTTNNAAWYVGKPGALQLMLRKGAVAPGGEVIGNLGFVLQMNAAGQVLFDVQFVLGSGAIPVTTANDRALWLYTPGVGNSQILREGDASPVPGLNYGNLAGTWSLGIGQSCFNSLGEALVRSDLTAPGIDDSALVRVSSSGAQVVVRKGDAVPGIPGAIFNTFNDVSLQHDDAGRVAFQASLLGTSGTTDDTAVFSGTVGGGVAVVVREGDPVPGLPGFTFQSVSGQPILSNQAGQLLFSVPLFDGVASVGSYWAWDSVVGLQLVGRVGDSIETQPGVFHPYSTAGGIQFSNGASRALTFRDNGDFHQQVFFGDGAACQMVGHVGSFVGVPSQLSAAAGGTHTMYLKAPAAQAGNTFLVLGSASGTSPGFPAGAFTCPLNPDIYFNITLQYANTPVFSNTLGTLDAAGKATAVLTIPPGVTSLVGFTLHHAYLTFSPFGALKFASEADGVTFLP